MDNYKVLLTGKNSIIKEDYFAKYENECILMSSSDRYSDMFNHIDYFKPNILLIGLNRETEDEMAAYFELKVKLMENGVQVVVVGTTEECNAFQSATDFMADLVLVKPVTAPLIKNKIETHLREINKEKDEASKKTAENKRKEAAVKAEVMGSASGRKHILVVDDDPIMLKMIKTNLIGEYDVSTVINGEIALNFLERRKTNLVLLDYNMPIMSGATVLEKIRQNPATASLPVVFLTGVTERGKIQKIMGFNPQGYLLKPIEKEHLIKMMHEQIGPGGDKSDDGEDK
jgi:CheY-like chemotaxis protein